MVAVGIVCDIREGTTHIGGNQAGRVDAQFGGQGLAPLVDNVGVEKFVDHGETPFAHDSSIAEFSDGSDNRCPRKPRQYDTRRCVRRHPRLGVEHRNGAARAFDGVERDVARLRDDHNIALAWNAIRFGSYRRASDHHYISQLPKCRQNGAVAGAREVAARAGLTDRVAQGVGHEIDSNPVGSQRVPPGHQVGRVLGVHREYLGVVVIDSHRNHFSTECGEVLEAGPTVSRISLADRTPSLTTAQMLQHLVPPPQFEAASFDSYVPDSAFPSQSESREAARVFALGGGGTFFRKNASNKAGLYLDGGFGVGKTHLLAAAWHRASGRKYFGTFIEYTALVGALGFAEATTALTGADFVAIDEFELDDPGDTMMMSRLLGELMGGGTRVMATSNTPPNALGEGRFAAADFLREISALADRFVILRIDGVDYRHRENEGRADIAAAADLTDIPDPLTVAEDSFGAVIRHIATLHPSKYVPLIHGVDVIVWRDVVPFTNQNDALRFVALVDRLYDADIPIRATGTPLDEVFPADMLDGGYRKKYLRSQSRLVALTHRPL